MSTKVDIEADAAESGDAGPDKSSSTTASSANKDETNANPKAAPDGFTVLSHRGLGGFFDRPTHARIQDDETGYIYEWNVRNHRKMRYPEVVPDDKSAESPPHPETGRLRFFTWAPNIITWHICWIGFVANTLWVINGLYAVWPEINESNATVISYATGVVGALMFIVTGYFGIVEVINQTHSDVDFPHPEKKRKRYKRTKPIYGQRRDPLGHDNHGLDADETRAFLFESGYPVIFDHETGRLVTGTETVPSSSDDEEEGGGAGTSTKEEAAPKTVDERANAVIGKEYDVLVGNHLFGVTVNSHADISKVDPRKLKMMAGHVAQSMRHLETKDGDDDKPTRMKDEYIWWTWDNDFHRVAVFNAYIFFISTIIFFIPAVIWYPVDEAGRASTGTMIFFIDVLQVVPSIGFCLVGHLAMAEVSGSFWKPALKSIGWWISFCNTVGGYGFLVCGALAIPSTAGKGSDDLYKWGSAFSTFWGSCAFWIAGVLQCMEFGSQHPITLKARK